MTECGWWSIKFTIEPNDVDLEHIGKCIKEGLTQGEMIHEEEEQNENETSV